MNFAEVALKRARPDSVREGIVLPRQSQFLASPADWRNEVLYFLLVDRFSDGHEKHRHPLDRNKIAAARAPKNGRAWSWSDWATSGQDHWQGGTLEGVKSKLGYLKGLGATTLWLSPVFKQRGHLDTYHGYGIEDFLEVDPHFGDRRSLVDLVEAAHAQDLRVILDIVFNHSGANWVYPGNQDTLPYKDYPDRYPFGAWLDREGRPASAIRDRDDGVWPREFQDPDRYTRAGVGSLDASPEEIQQPHAVHKRTDFGDLRDFELEKSGVLDDLARCYKYWIALTDCDGFRIDTLKHVSLEDARNFCGTIKEFATNIGKNNFFLVGEVAGGTYNEDLYLDVLRHNLNAALDIGNMRPLLEAVAKGLAPAQEYFAPFTPGRFKQIGSHRHAGTRYVSIADDHDHVGGPKTRFSVDAASDHQVVAAVALQLYSLGIPCIYYGTEQALAGPEPQERQWLPEWEGSDRYLREAMFGPEHPRRRGLDGLLQGKAGIDTQLPGFGPFGTAGYHCFDHHSPAYLRIAALTNLRKKYSTLRYGRQYQRPIAFLGKPFDYYGPGELIAWSRILDDEEMLCVVNCHGTDARGADIIVDAGLNRPPESVQGPRGNSASMQGCFMTVVLNTAQAAVGTQYRGSYPLGAQVPVIHTPDGTAYVNISDLGASEVIVLANHDKPEDGRVGT